MFYLLFKVGDQQYALKTSQVLEILPMLQLRSVVRAPDYVAGTFTYGNRIIPVVDLSVMMGQSPSRTFYSTRLILVQVNVRPERRATLGLLALGGLALLRRRKRSK